MDKKILKHLIRLLLGVAAIVLVWWIIRCQCINLEEFSPASIRDYIQSFGKLSAIVYIFAYALNTISIFPPIAVLSLSAGLAFGKLWGAIYLMIGAMLGTSCTFCMSRFFARSIVERLFKGKFKKLDDLLEKKGFITVLFFRVIPIVPYEVLNYASGLSKIKFRDYFIATLLGLVPGVIIAAFFGGTLGEVRGLRDLLSSKFIIASLALIIVILVPIIYQNMKRKRVQ